MADVIFAQYGNTVNTPIEQYFVNDVSDLDQIEKKFGTVAYVISKRKLYICNADLEWTDDPTE